MQKFAVPHLESEHIAADTSHVERAGTSGSDLAVVFEGRKGGNAILVAPPTGGSAAAARATRS